MKIKITGWDDDAKHFKGRYLQPPHRECSIDPFVFTTGAFCTFYRDNDSNHFFGIEHADFIKQFIGKTVEIEDNCQIFRPIYLPKTLVILEDSI